MERAGREKVAHYSLPMRLPTSGPDLRRCPASWSYWVHALWAMAALCPLLALPPAALAARHHRRPQPPAQPAPTPPPASAPKSAADAQKTEAELEAVKSE